MSEERKRFEANLDYINNLNAIFKYLTNNKANALDVSDILRAELTMTESALDLYIHEIVKTRIIEMYVGSRKKSKGYSKIKICLESPLNNDKEKIEQKLIWLDSEIAKQQSRKSFIRSDTIPQALSQVCDIDIWAEVAKEIKDDQKEMKRKINLIADRRNKIVHEADAKLPFKDERWDIDENEVNEAIDFIKKIVGALDTILDKN